MAVKKEIAAWLLNINKEQLEYALLKLEQAPIYIAEDDEDWVCPYCEKEIRRHV